VVCKISFYFLWQALTIGDDVFQSLYDNPLCQAHEGRVLFLTRHGESEDNLHGKIGVIDFPLRWYKSTVAFLYLGKFIHQCSRGKVLGPSRHLLQCESIFKHQSSFQTSLFLSSKSPNFIETSFKRFGLVNWYVPIKRQKILMHQKLLGLN